MILLYHSTSVFHRQLRDRGIAVGDEKKGGARALNLGGRIDYLVFSLHLSFVTHKKF